MKVIVNADDLGLSKAVNYGIIDSYRNGIVTSAAILMNAQAVEHAIELIKTNPQLGVGIHLVLSSGKPLLGIVNSLTDEKGNFKNIREISQHPDLLDLDEVYKEWDEQIKKFISYGLVPTHLNCHHNVHIHGHIYKVFLDLAKKYNLPVRNYFGKAADKIDPLVLDNIKMPDSYVADFDFDISELKKSEDFRKAAQQFISLLAQSLKPGRTAEIVVHPGYIDETIMKEPEHYLERTDVSSFLMEPEIKNLFKKNGLKLITFSNL